MKQGIIITGNIGKVAELLKELEAIYGAEASVAQVISEVE